MASHTKAAIEALERWADGRREFTTAAERYGVRIRSARGGEGDVRVEMAGGSGAGRRVGAVEEKPSDNARRKASDDGDVGTASAKSAPIDTEAAAVVAALKADGSFDMLRKMAISQLEASGEERRLKELAIKVLREERATADRLRSWNAERTSRAELFGELRERLHQRTMARHVFRSIASLITGSGDIQKRLRASATAAIDAAAAYGDNSGANAAGEGSGGASHTGLVGPGDDGRRRGGAKISETSAGIGRGDILDGLLERGRPHTAASMASRARARGAGVAGPGGPGGMVTSGENGVSSSDEDESGDDSDSDSADSGSSSSEDNSSDDDAESGDSEVDTGGSPPATAAPDAAAPALDSTNPLATTTTAATTTTSSLDDDALLSPATAPTAKYPAATASSPPKEEGSIGDNPDATNKAKASSAGAVNSQPPRPSPSPPLRHVATDQSRRGGASKEATKASGRASDVGEVNAKRPKAGAGSTSVAAKKAVPATTGDDAVAPVGRTRRAMRAASSEAQQGTDVGGTTTRRASATTATVETATGAAAEASGQRVGTRTTDETLANPQTATRRGRRATPDVAKERTSTPSSVQSSGGRARRSDSSGAVTPASKDGDAAAAKKDKGEKIVAEAEGAIDDESDKVSTYPASGRPSRKRAKAASSVESSDNGTDSGDGGKDAANEETSRLPKRRKPDEPTSVRPTRNVRKRVEPAGGTEVEEAPTDLPSRRRPRGEQDLPTRMVVRVAGRVLSGRPPPLPPSPPPPSPPLSTPSSAKKKKKKSKAGSAASAAPALDFEAMMMQIQGQVREERKEKQQQQATAPSRPSHKATKPKKKVEEGSRRSSRGRSTQGT